MDSRTRKHATRRGDATFPREDLQPSPLTNSFLRFVSLLSSACSLFPFGLAIDIHKQNAGNTPTMLFSFCRVTGSPIRSTGGKAWNRSTLDQFLLFLFNSGTVFPSLTRQTRAKRPTWLPGCFALSRIPRTLLLLFVGMRFTNTIKYYCVHPLFGSLTHVRNDFTYRRFKVSATRCLYEFHKKDGK